MPGGHESRQMWVRGSTPVRGGEARRQAVTAWHTLANPPPALLSRYGLSHDAAAAQRPARPAERAGWRFSDALRVICPGVGERGRLRPLEPTGAVLWADKAWKNKKTAMRRFF
ncbi:hypothetical protein [Escherichia coli]|uniref:hypothetical protein n=1 Tax=Escherichia coli TaxID=562 RepID=UPI00390CD8E0|nr:hypothetical protein [Escherichia coli]